MTGAAAPARRSRGVGGTPRRARAALGRSSEGLVFFSGRRRLTPGGSDNNSGGGEAEEEKQGQTDWFRESARRTGAAEGGAVPHG